MRIMRWSSSYRINPLSRGIISTHFPTSRRFRKNLKINPYHQTLTSSIYAPPFASRFSYTQQAGLFTASRPSKPSLNLKKESIFSSDEINEVRKIGLERPEDLASLLFNSLSEKIKKAKADENKLKNLKIKANIYAATATPPYIIDAINSGNTSKKASYLSLNTLLDFTEPNSKKLILKLQEQIQKNEDLKKKIMQYLAAKFLNNIGSILKKEANQNKLSESTIRYLYHFVMALRDRKIAKTGTALLANAEKRMLENAALLWLDIGSRVGKEIWEGRPDRDKNHCECDWENSIFSEKAYLIYLSKIINYDAEKLKVESKKEGVEIDLENDTVKPKSKCMETTTVKQAIIFIQKKLREMPEQQLLEKNFNSQEPALPFLEYEEWLASEIRIHFPENEVDSNLAETPFILFPDENTETDTATLQTQRIQNQEKINKFALALENTIPFIGIEGRVRGNEIEFNETRIISDNLPESEMTQTKSIGAGLIGGKVRFPIIKLTQVSWPNAERFFPWQFLWQIPPTSILANNYQIISLLLQLYNNLSFSLRIGFQKNDWTNAVGPLNGDIYVNNPGNRLIKDINLKLKEILGNNEIGKLLLLDLEPPQELLEKLKSGDSGWYAQYKEQMRQVRTEFNNYSKNLTHIISSIFPLSTMVAVETGRDALPINNGFYTLENINAKIRYALTNSYNLVTSNKKGKSIRLPLVKYLNTDIPNSATEIMDDPSKLSEDDEVYQNNPEVINAFKEENLILKSFNKFFLEDNSVYGFPDKIEGMVYDLDENMIHLPGNEDIKLADVFLANLTRIINRLELKATFGERSKINRIKLVQLYFNLLQHLPYIRHFIIPFFYAKYELANNNYLSALRALSLIYDHTDSFEFLTPFSLNFSEQAAIRLFLCEIYLAQAETLFRENTPESIQHAKELYEKIIKIFVEYKCFCDLPQKDHQKEEAVLLGKSVSEILSKNKLPSALKDKFMNAFIRCNLRNASNREAIREISKLNKNNELSKSINDFVNRVQQQKTDAVSFKKNLATQKEYFISPPKVELDHTMSDADHEPIFTEPDIDEILGRPTREDFLKALGDKLGIPLEKIHPPIIDKELFPPHPFPPFRLQIEFGLCNYPNPRIVSIVSKACNYLSYINDCRNFLGYRDDDISIYSYEELLKKSRHYSQEASDLEDKYINYRAQFENEQKDQIKALQSVLKDKAMMNLANLQITESQQLVDLSKTQRAKAVHMYETLQKESDYRNSPLGVLTRFHNTGTQAAGKGFALSGGNPIVGAIIGGIDAMIGFANWSHEDEMFQAQVETSKYDVAIANQNIAMAATRLAISQTQEAIANIDLQMDKIYLQYLHNKLLSGDIYLYMFNRVKQLYKDYMEMAIRFAWLAERQIEFLRGTEINTIRFNYYHTKNQGIETGLLLAAKTLKKDIESLNYQMELSEKNPIRVKKTFSLRREYAIFFANFLKFGVIQFRTTADYVKFRNENGGLVYDGHTQRPEYYGYLQQRIESIELRLLGLIGPDQDIRISLSNCGTSLVLIENPNPLLAQDNNPVVPIVLHRRFQTIAFNRMRDQDTEFVYRFTAEKGVLKPFETIGLDTTWELRMDPITNQIDLNNIYDIQLIINYNAQYSRNYENLQRPNINILYPKDKTEYEQQFEEWKRTHTTRNVLFIRHPEEEKWQVFVIKDYEKKLIVRDIPVNSEFARVLQLINPDDPMAFDVQKLINLLERYDLFKNYFIFKRTRIFSLRNDFSDAFYSFNQAKYMMQGARDLRFMELETDGDKLGPNEAGQQVENIRFFVRPKNLLPAVMQWKIGVANKKKLNNFSFFRQVSSQFLTEIQNPESPAENISVNGCLDYSDEFTAGDPPVIQRRNITNLFKDPTTIQIRRMLRVTSTSSAEVETPITDRAKAMANINKKWSIKMFSDNNPDYHQKDAAGMTVDMPGNVLVVKTNTNQNIYRIKTPPENIAKYWDSYQAQIKFKMLKGSIALGCRINDNSGIFIKINKQDNPGNDPAIKDTIQIYSKNSNSDGYMQISEPLEFPIATQEWYQLECVVIQKETNNVQLKLMLDKLTLWEEAVPLTAQDPYGSINIVADPNTEAYFDDLLVQRVNRHGQPVLELFKDTFNGNHDRDWIELDNSNNVVPQNQRCFSLQNDENPALDLSQVEDVMMVVDYSFKSR